MQSSNVVIRSTQLANVGIKQQVLKNQSKVLVRVISNSGNGRYTGSVAGVRVNLISSKNLTPGMTFVAKISVSNGQIELQTDKSSSLQSQSIQLSVVDNDRLVSFLQFLGVPADSISEGLLKLFKQMELKIDFPLLNKLHNRALKFENKEKSASELLLALHEKGIDTSLEELLGLIQYLENDEQSESEKKRGESLLNNFNKTPGSWFIIPFDFVKVKENQIIGNGVIRLLINKNNQAKLINLDCNYNSRRYLFSLVLQNDSVKKIKMNISDFNVENIESLLLNLKNRMIKTGSIIDIQWCDSSEIEGNAFSDEEFYSFEGTV